MSDYRFIKRQMPPIERAVDVFAALTDNGRTPGSVLLETADGLTPEAGKSLLLLSPCLRIDGFLNEIRVRALTSNGHQLLQRLSTLSKTMVNDNGEALSQPLSVANSAENEQQRLLQEPTLNLLRSLLNQLHASHTDEEKLFMLSGIFSFETIRLFEHLPALPGEQDKPLFTLFLPELVLQLPRAGQSVSAYALVTEGEQSARIENDMSRQLVALSEKLRHVSKQETPAGAAAVNVEVDIADDAFERHVQTAKLHLRAGDAFQIVISRRFSLPCADALQSYRVLRQENPSPYLFYVNTGDCVLFGASPESAVKVDGATREIEVCPIAGTRARGRNAGGEIDADYDARIEADLRADEKEIAEHMMLVDLARNDVARIAAPGTRRVKQLLTVERYSRVMHLVSRVAGNLKPGLDALHAYAASMPMGTLSGAPKLRAIEIIRQLEGKPRGAYGGAVGYLNAQGDMDTAIIIRAAVVRDGKATVQAGAGVVLASDPAAEADESRRKAESVLRAIHGANLAANGRSRNHA